VAGPEAGGGEGHRSNGRQSAEAAYGALKPLNRLSRVVGVLAMVLPPSGRTDDVQQSES